MTLALSSPAELIAAIEPRRRRIQVEIDADRTARERNRLGQFATPYPLALDIAREAMRYVNTDSPIQFGEPSIGTGAFYSALRDVLGTTPLASAVGVEVDPRFVVAARDMWGSSGLKVVSGDFTYPATIAQAQPRPNVILANPPYVRHHHLDPIQKEALRDQVKALGIPVSGLAGLYVYFMLLAHDWLQDDGLAIWLIPSEFMDVNYGTALKTYLTERVTLLRIHRFDPVAVQFDDALVSSAVVVFRKTLPTADWQARFTYGGPSLEHPALCQDVSLTDLRTARKWTSYPRPADHASKALPLHSDALTLGDLFKVQRGIATGANEFFVLPRSQARALELPEACLRPILPSPRNLRGATVIERAPDGYPLLPDPQVMIDCDYTEAEVSRRFPTLWNYLQQGRSRGVTDGYLISKRSPWYKQEQRAVAPFLCTYMGRSRDAAHPFRFILNRSNAVAANVYLMLYPTGPLAALLHQQPEADAEILSLLGEITAADLKTEGRVYGGGLHKIEPKELARLPAATLTQRFPQLLQAQNTLPF